MNYHIETTPIWDAFKAGGECPVCSIRERNSEKLVNQYLGEAVMEPDYRIEVNKKGFCDEHFRALFAGKNKLGLTLQTQTRLEYITDRLPKVQNAKAAAKAAEKLTEFMGTCVICSQLDATMELYYETVARMYGNESEFRALFSKGKGFCLPHYAALLRFSKQAGKFADEFAATLSKMQEENLRRLYKEMGLFTDRFDAHKKNPAPVSETETTSLLRSVNKLRGNILK